MGRDVADPSDRERAMRVYVLETGCYEQQGVAGIFTSVEAAVAASPIREGATVLRPGGWKPDDAPGFEGHWNNGCDWDDAASIWPTEVRGML